MIIESTAGKRGRTLSPVSALAVLCVLAAGACGSGPGGGGSGTGGASGANGGSGGADAGDAGAGGTASLDGGSSTGGAGGGGALPFAAITPCDSESAYVGGRTVSTSGETYDPPCLRVTVGTTVTIEASAGHPLSPRTGGTASNPIPSQSASADVRFTAPGFYPYECVVHTTEGMIGVIWVVP